MFNSISLSILGNYPNINILYQNNDEIRINGKHYVWDIFSFRDDLSNCFVQRFPNTACDIYSDQDYHRMINDIDRSKYIEPIAEFNNIKIALDMITACENSFSCNQHKNN